MLATDRSWRGVVWEWHINTTPSPYVEKNQLIVPSVEKYWAELIVPRPRHHLVHFFMLRLTCGICTTGYGTTQTTIASIGERWN